MLVPNTPTNPGGSVRSLAFDALTASRVTIPNAGLVDTFELEMLARDVLLL